MTRGKISQPPSKKSKRKEYYLKKRKKYLNDINKKGE
jgi:hypothetical protein|tara:strand:+ start:773 stop:883 length:111 start_codon:yes stop_codon:yes gene_type:complete